MNTDIDISKFRKLDGSLLLILQELLHSRSVTRTAEALSLSQSTISQSLGRLRELFGDPLFVRKPHGMEPTQHALQLEPRIALLIELAASTFDAGNSFEPIQSNRSFVISAPEFVTVDIATKLLNRLETIAPQVHVQFVHTPETVVLDKLRRGEIACALGRFEQSHFDIEQFHLYKDEFCVAVRKGNPLATGRLTAKKYQAAKHIWVNSPTEVIQRDFEFDFSAYRGSIVPRWLTALVIAASSDYVATCPRRLAESQAELLNLKLLNLSNVEPLEVSLACRRESRDKGIEWLIDQVRLVAQ